MIAGRLEIGRASAFFVDMEGVAASWHPHEIVSLSVTVPRFSPSAFFTSAVASAASAPADVSADIGRPTTNVFSQDMRSSILPGFQIAILCWHDPPRH